MPRGRWGTATESRTILRVCVRVCVCVWGGGAFVTSRGLARSVVSLDLTDEHRLREAFALYNFTHVLHLAAQAGVRYARENPLAYVSANVDAFVKLLVRRAELA